MYHIFFIHSSVDGHLGCFHVFAIVNTSQLLLTARHCLLTILKMSIDICYLQFIFSHFLLISLHWSCVHLITRTLNGQVVADINPDAQFTKTLRAPLTSSVGSVWCKWPVPSKKHAPCLLPGAHTPLAFLSSQGLLLPLSLLPHHLNSLYLLHLPLPPPQAPHSFTALSTTNASCQLPEFEWISAPQAPTSWQAEDVLGAGIQQLLNQKVGKRDNRKTHTQYSYKD